MDRPWRVERFDRGVHDRSQFDCGINSLNEWLERLVSQFEKRDLSRTYVLLHQESPVVKGYYSLSSHSIFYEALPEDQARGLPRIDVPAVLLGRLAVDASVKGQGLGELLLIDALRRADYLSNQVGIRAVEVHALDESARGFYLKYGFIPLQDDPQHLFLPITIVRKLRLSPLSPPG